MKKHKAEDKLNLLEKLNKQIDEKDEVIMNLNVNIVSLGDDIQELKNKVEKHRQGELYHKGRCFDRKGLVEALEKENKELKKNKTKSKVYDSELKTFWKNLILNGKTESEASELLTIMEAKFK